jgi:hypothetical protein
MAIYSRKDVFDEMHQKRLFVLHLENVTLTLSARYACADLTTQVTTHEHHLHIASADGAPGFHELVKDITGEFAGLSAVESVPVVMNDHNSDWDSLYPFSAVRIRQLPVSAKCLLTRTLSSCLRTKSSSRRIQRIPRRG